MRHVRARPSQRRGANVAKERACREGRCSGCRKESRSDSTWRNGDGAVCSGHDTYRRRVSRSRHIIGSGCHSGEPTAVVAAGLRLSMRGHWRHLGVEVAVGTETWLRMPSRLFNGNRIRATQRGTRDCRLVDTSSLCVVSKIPSPSRQSQMPLRQRLRTFWRGYARGEKESARTHRASVSREFSARRSVSARA